MLPLSSQKIDVGYFILFINRNNSFIGATELILKFFY
jgi:hypothetical protein